MQIVCAIAGEVKSLKNKCDDVQLVKTWVGASQVSVAHYTRKVTQVREASKSNARRTPRTPVARKARMRLAHAPKVSPSCSKLVARNRC